MELETPLATASAMALVNRSETVSAMASGTQ
jgi:hypothetical protein